MTAGATDAARQVFGLGKVLRLQTGLVTLRANRRSLDGAQVFEANDLGHVSATIDVGLRGTVTPLTTVFVAFEQCCMRRIRKMLVPHFLVASLANVGFSVLAGIRTGQCGRGLWSGVARRLLSLRSDNQAAA